MNLPLTPLTRLWYLRVDYDGRGPSPDPMKWVIDSMEAVILPGKVWRVDEQGLTVFGAPFEIQTGKWTLHLTEDGARAELIEWHRNRMEQARTAIEALDTGDTREVHGLDPNARYD